MVTYNFHHFPLHMQSPLRAKAAEHCAKAQGKAQYCFKKCFFSAKWRRKVVWLSTIKAPTAGHHAEFPPLGEQQWPVGAGCLLCSYLLTCFLKTIPSPAGVIRMPHPWQSWQLSPSPPRRCGLAAPARWKSKGSLVTPWTGGAAAQGPPQTPEGVCPGDFVLFLQLSPVGKKQGKQHPKIPPPNRSSWGVIKHWTQLGTYLLFNTHMISILKGGEAEFLDSNCLNPSSCT